MPLSGARLLTQRDVPSGFVALGGPDTDLANEGASETAAVHALCPARSEGQEPQTAIPIDDDTWVMFEAGGSEHPTDVIDQGILHYRGGDATRYMQGVRKAGQNCAPASTSFDGTPPVTLTLEEIPAGTRDDLLVYRFAAKPNTQGQLTAFARVGDDVVVMSWQWTGAKAPAEADFARLVRAATTAAPGATTTTSTLPRPGETFSVEGRDLETADLAGSYHAVITTMFASCTTKECGRLTSEGLDWTIAKQGDGYVLSMFDQTVPLRDQGGGSYVAEGDLPVERRTACSSGPGITRFGMSFNAITGVRDANGVARANEVAGRYSELPPDPMNTTCTAADTDYIFRATRR